MIAVPINLQMLQQPEMRKKVSNWQFEVKNYQIHLISVKRITNFDFEIFASHPTKLPVAAGLLVAEQS